MSRYRDKPVGQKPASTGTLKIDNPIIGKVESSGGPLPYVVVIGIFVLMGMFIYFKWGHPKVKSRWGKK